MSRRNIDPAIAAANPVPEAAIHASTLAEVDRKLREGIARERAEDGTNDSSGDALRGF